MIGHEISHGFDDQGSKYDGKGVFQDWWTKEDRANFDAKTAAMVKQYDAFEPLPGLHVIGANTLARILLTMPASPSRLRPITSHCMESRRG